MSLRDRLPSLFPLLDDESRLKIIVDALDDELRELEQDIDTVQDSLFVETADGQSLDLIGDDFGQIGERRGRDDQAYRQFLQSIVPAFNGRGTERDVEVAVAAGIAVDADNIDLIQDFDNQEYELVLHSWTAHESGTVRELSELADPAGVERRDPVHLISQTAPIDITTADTSIAPGTVSETATPTIATAPSTNSIYAIGLSSPELQGLSTDDWILSLQNSPAAVIEFVTGDTETATNPRLPTARPRVQASSTVARSMTRLGPARPDVTARSTDRDTVSTRGLSSNALGDLSTTNMDALA